MKQATRKALDALMQAGCCVLRVLLLGSSTTGIARPAGVIWLLWNGWLRTERFAASASPPSLLHSSIPPKQQQ